MDYLLITSRPHFAPFALRQFEKCSNCNLVVLQNGGYTEFWDLAGVENYYKTEWRHFADCFNWFLDNYDFSDFILMDDDIFLLRDIAADLRGWLTKGFDRVLFTSSFFYDTRKKGLMSFKPWPPERVGAAWAIDEKLAPLARCPERPAAAVLRYYLDLPQHNVRMIPTPGIIHLIHGENVALTEKLLEGASIAPPPGLLGDIKLIEMSNNKASN